MTPLRPGDPRTLGPYRLLGVLGAGGLVRVYLGEPTRGRPVAITALPREVFADRAERRRLRREVAAGRRVTSRFAAGIIDADLRADPPWFATSYVEGPSLDHVVRSRGPLSAESALTLFAGLIDALDAIHRAGLVHGDVKPSNVLLTDSGLRLIDIGVGWSPEAPMGAPGFLSPEHLGPGPTPASDIFCAAATVAFATTGEPPLGRGSPQTLLARLAAGQWTLGAVPTGLREVLQPCLAQRPDERPKLGVVRKALRSAGARPPGAGWLSAGHAPGYAEPSRGAAPPPPADETPHSAHGATNPTTGRGRRRMRRRERSSG